MTTKQIVRKIEGMWAGLVWPTAFTRKQQSPKRVKKFGLSFGRSVRIVISLRRFRTNPDRRSTRFKQYVVQPRVGAYRELALAIHHKTKRQPKSGFRQFATRAVLPAIMTVVGLSGLVGFSLAPTQSTNLSVEPKPAAAAKVPEQPPAPQPKVMARSEPTRIRIPKIALDTSIVPVGLDANGSMALPGYDVGGWYNGGPTPGEMGPATIVGHVDSTTDRAVFWHLRELVPGDIVAVDRQDGSTANFRVTELKLVPQDAFPTTEVYGDIPYAGLRLITCGGTYNEATGRYSHNTVIFATLE